MVIGLALVADAAPVECDAEAAARLLVEARIEESRAPVSHPELIPGLALASAGSDPALKEALRDLCSGSGDLSLSVAARWEGADASAHSFLLTRGSMEGCTLHEDTIAISVGVRADSAPVYRMLYRPPPARTPVGDCAGAPVYRDEREIDGDGGPVRLVLITDHDGDELLHAQVAVRSASAEGWSEKILLDPAPARLVGGFAGPLVELTDRYEEKWVVAHADRTDEPCLPIEEQTVWTATDGWVAHTGTDALTLLARRGLWRMTGQDGWFVIVAQDPEDDAERLRQRLPRLEARNKTKLDLLASANFPLLNPGFLIAVLGPFPTEHEAVVARRAWWPRAQAYVKQGWAAPDPCAAPLGGG